ncbi:DDE-type integrase/transposase/recombinase, partial [Aeromonas caviae]|uniref:DDE-type integrase/transposase/recombinase n=1 Tax=Aeromonas caviae TaxID=648 RepID=UPI001F29DF1B
YLYLIEDIYSRKGVGWEVHEQECGERAAALLQRSIIREQCWKQPLVLHSDNGAPMKSVTLLTKMHDLGVTPSRGRPRVSNWLITSCRSANNIMPITFFLPAFIASS